MRPKGSCATRKPVVLGLFVLVACSSSSGTSSSGGSGGPQFQITLPSGEVSNFSCSADTSGGSLSNGSVQFTCDVGAAATTAPGLYITGFHGSDTYALQQTAGTDQIPIVNFDADDYAWAAIGAAPGLPATTCSTQLTSPAKPEKGLAISGKFHCDNVVGNIIVGDGGHNPSRVTSVDGTFSGVFTH